MFVPKAENPITIRLGEGKAEVLLGDGTSLDLYSSEKRGVAWKNGSGRYGIHLIRDMSNKAPIEMVYLTQCEIECVSLDKQERTLYVWERDKMPSSWKFNERGDLLQIATYQNWWDPTREFIFEHEQEIRKNLKGAIPVATNREDLIDIMINEANRVNNISLNLREGKSKTPAKTTGQKKTDGGKV